MNNIPESSWPLPVHGGGKELAIGTKMAILSFIKKNNELIDERR